MAMHMCTCSSISLPQRIGVQMTTQKSRQMSLQVSCTAFKSCMAPLISALTHEIPWPYLQPTCSVKSSPQCIGVQITTHKSRMNSWQVSCTAFKTCMVPLISALTLEIRWPCTCAPATDMFRQVITRMHWGTNNNAQESYEVLAGVVHSFKDLYGPTDFRTSARNSMAMHLCTSN